MALQVTRWYPDTCDCIIDYEWDVAQPEATRTHTVKAIIKRCAAHRGIRDDSQHFSTVLEENVRKNQVVNRALALKANLNIPAVLFSFDERRALHIVFGSHLSDTDKSSIQAWCDSAIGKGQVIVE